MDQAAFARTCSGLGIELTGAQLSAFEGFECALYEANRTRNLTRVPQAECWLRHFVDSLLIAEFLPHGASALDIGSGPGFPAWPLACGRPDLAVTALDSSGKMLDFLGTQPLPNLAILQGRAEENPPREAFDTVTGRALAPLAIQIELSAAPCKVGGMVIPMRTPGDEPFPPPAPGLGLRLEGTERRELPGTEIVRVFPIYRKVKSTAPKFPRTWAEIRRAATSPTSSSP
ncbi:MAG TPA: 16S rRNA (guanine(527)-N(7))-methyltransferase RsmG [Fimbriimonadaceae bacterium]|nr:16S rRNA (guanine(527)-N(7))-methyltransferase RsmG [Fimbriimonadaceae bacterium]